MTRRGTITLFVLAIGTITYFFLSRLTEQPLKDGLIFHFHADKVTRIVITDGNDVHTLQREQDAWYISTSPPDRVSDKKIDHLLAMAQELKPLNILKPSELKHQLSLSSLGLQNPKRSISFHKEGAQDETLFIGNEAVGDKSVFAQLENQKSVMIIPSEIATIAFANSDDFRDPYLTTLRLDDLQEIIITRGMGKLCLKKENEKWQMTQPISGMISPDALATWIAPLFTTEMLTRVSDDHTNLAYYGLDQPRANISLLEEDSLEPVKLDLGNMLEEKNIASSAPSYYLRSSARHAIFIVPAALSELFMITPEALRDHQLFKLNLDMVDRIEITTPTKALSLRRQPLGTEEREDWILNNQQVISQATLQKMVETLAQTKILSYQVATPSKKAALGLDESSQPTGSIQFIAHLSENTPDDQAGDHTVMTVTFGKQIGQTIFAHIGRDPELVEIPAETIDLLNVK